MPPAIQLEFPRLHRELSETMQPILDSRCRIVFVDEVCFTKSTYLKRAYSSKGCNIEIDQTALYGGYWSAIAAISTANVVESVKVKKGAVNHKDFVAFLSSLRKRLKSDQAYIFMD